MISFRVMTPDDIPFGMELKGHAGWNQTEQDWRRFLRLNPEGCFVGLIDGQAAGTITTTVYERRLAWIGMVLVHPSFRRRGLGSAMLCHALDYLNRRGVQTVKLDATDAGRKVYEPLGFVDEVPMERLEGQGANFQHDAASMTEADIERLAAAGITRGCNPPVNDRFCPDSKVTRGQMAAFLVRGLGLGDDGTGDRFVDDDETIFERDIDRLAAAGITRGCNPPENDRFCPDRNVTRGEMAAFLRRGLGA